MVSKREVDRFVESQQSIQFYEKIRVALKNVLLKLSDKEFNDLTKGLVVMAIHEGVLGQVMHFKPKENLRVMQLTFPKKVPLDVLEFVIAHELGHVAQKRNWEKSDGSNLEADADKRAAEWGFKKTKKIEKWMKSYAKNF